MQFQAGYLLDSCNALIQNLKEKNKIEELLYSLSFFDVEFMTQNEKSKEIDSIFAVASNLISRGLPTKPSLFIENYISEVFKNSIHVIETKIFETLHLIDPRIKPATLWNQLNNNTLEDETGITTELIYSHIPTYLGDAFLQLFEYQRSFLSVLPNTQRKILRETFENQQVDFAIEIPYQVENNKGIIVEIEDEKNLLMSQQLLDKRQDDLVASCGWQPTVRLKIDDYSKINEKIKPIQQFIQHSYFDLIVQNYRNPLYLSVAGIGALQYTLSPFAIARIQKTLLQVILNGTLQLSDKEWNIAIIERDVPCAFLAIEDFKQLINNLFIIEGKGRELPPINLTIYNTDQFRIASLNSNAKDLIKNIIQFDVNNNYDLLIDVSVLQRNYYKNSKIISNAKNIAIIRSAHSISNTRQFIYCDLITYLFSDIYNENPENINLKQKNSLQYFLQTIFRKNDFLEGQYNSLQRILFLKNTVVSMWFTSGKSTIYQLASLLQPALSVAIEPFKTLSYEQQLKLKEYKIDCYDFIDHTDLETDNQYDTLLNHEKLILFSTPDNFSNLNFRNKIQNFNKFAYVTVDEAHSVSEWSSDFKYSYINLCANIQKFCKTNQNNEAVLVGLCNPVLQNEQFDLLYEFECQHYVTPSPFTLPNSRTDFQIMPFSTSDNSSTNIKRKKNSIIQELIDNNKNSNFLLLFNELSDLQEYARGQFNPKIYTGTTDFYLNDVNKITEKENLLSLNQFIDNQINVLVASNEIAEGIDKQNLKNIINYNLPYSIESYLTQSYRVGRDGGEATSAILFPNYSSIQKDDSNAISSLLEKWHVRFKGKEKEKQIINELLNTSVEYKITPYLIIKEKLEFELGGEFIFEFKPAEYPYELSVNQHGWHCGSIDFRTFTTYFRNIQVNKELAEKVINYIYREIQNNCNETDKLAWLTNSKTLFTKTLASILESEKYNEKTDISIPFESSNLIEIYKIINKYFPNQLSISLLNNYYSQSSDFVHFNEAILSTTMLGNSIPENEIKKVEILFYNHRNVWDSLKAIHHLLQVGVIDDFTIDRTNKIFTVTVSKKEDKVYLAKIYNYYLRYYTKNYAQQISSELSEFKGNNLIDKCIDSIVSHVNETISKKQFTSLKFIETICMLGLCDKDDIQLKQLVTDYFESKYANIILPDNLISATNNFTEIDFTFFINYLKTIGYSHENLYHLNNSTEKILNGISSNYIICLLQAYSMLSLLNDHIDEEMKQNINTILNFLAKAIYQLKIDEKWDYIEHKNNIDWLINLIYKNNPPIKQVVDNLLIIKTQRNWLSNFNSKFLENYERINEC